MVDGAFLSHSATVDAATTTVITRRQIILLDGLLGIVIGATSLAWVSATSQVARDKLLVFQGASAFWMLFLGIPMFIATVALAPVLLKVIGSMEPQPRTRYYLKSALAGIVFGVAVSALIGVILGFIVPFLPNPEGTTSLQDRALLLGGAPLFMGIGIGLFSLFMFKQLVLTGTLFGMLNAWLLLRVEANEK